MFELNVNFLNFNFRNPRNLRCLELPKLWFRPEKGRLY
jgi:hypothetical protein